MDQLEANRVRAATYREDSENLSLIKRQNRPSLQTLPAPLVDLATMDYLAQQAEATHPQQLAARTATVQPSTPGQPSEQYYFLLFQHNNPTRNAYERVIRERRTNTPWKPATRRGFLILPQHTIITSSEPSKPTNRLTSSTACNDQHDPCLSSRAPLNWCRPGRHNRARI